MGDQRTEDPSIQPSTSTSRRRRARPRRRDPGSQLRSTLARLPRNARGAALGIVMRLEAGDAEYEAIWRDDPIFTGLQPRDRRLTYFLASGALKFRKKLDHIAHSYTGRKWEHTHPIVRHVLRQALFQLIGADRVPNHAAVFAAVEMTKRLGHATAAGMVNAVLRNYLRAPDRVYYPNRETDLIDHLSLMNSYPEWLVRLLIDLHGEELAEQWLVWGNAPPRFHLRINDRKTVRDTVAAIVAEHVGEVPRFVPGFDGFLEVPSSVLVRDNPVIAEGLGWVQSPASSLVVDLLDPQHGDTVLDLFAAPGGKSFESALRVGDEGQVLSVDKNDGRLKLLVENRERLGIDNVLPIQADVTELAPHAADCVLADCPCSALGTLAKSAEVRWTKLPADVERLSRAQRDWLAAAAQHVKPGGVLVYSVCTITPDETAAVVDEFLRSHPGFTLEPPPSSIAPDFTDERGFVRTLPPRDGIEGIFAARLRRQSDNRATE